MWTSPAWTPAAADPMGESIIPSTMKVAQSTSRHFCKDPEAPCRCRKHNCGADRCIGQYIMSLKLCLPPNTCVAQDLPNSQLQNSYPPWHAGEWYCPRWRCPWCQMRTPGRSLQSSSCDATLSLASAGGTAGARRRVATWRGPLLRRGSRSLHAGAAQSPAEQSPGRQIVCKAPPLCPIRRCTPIHSGTCVVCGVL